MKMNDVGEKSEKAVKKHAAAWLKANQSQLSIVGKSNCK